MEATMAATAEIARSPNRDALANASDALSRIEPAATTTSLRPVPQQPAPQGKHRRKKGKTDEPRPRPPARAPARTTTGTDVAAYIAAVALAGIAAVFSIRGMAVLFPGAPGTVIAMAGTMEGAKLVTAGWLAARWSRTAWIWRFALVGFIAGLAVINATGVYAQLVAAHVGSRGEAQSAIETQDAALEGKIEVAVHNVADLDRRLNQVDSAIEEAAKRGKTATALSAIDGQRKTRAALALERQGDAESLAALKAERATIGAKGRQLESEAAPIRYVAELVGSNADAEQAIRWLILLMVLCCDPLAIALTAAASAGRAQP
jgi:hypothetical protein